MGGGGSLRGETRLCIRVHGRALRGLALRGGGRGKEGRMRGQTRLEMLVPINHEHCKCASTSTFFHLQWWTFRKGHGTVEEYGLAFTSSQLFEVGKYFHLSHGFPISKTDKISDFRGQLKMRGDKLKYPTSWW